MLARAASLLTSAVDLRQKGDAAGRCDSRVDRETKTIYVNKAIKEAAEFDELQYRDNAYRDRVGIYYGGAGAQGD